MQNVSVVIITKNEAANIRECIIAARAISNDIIVIDSGSTDNTVAIAKKEQARAYSIEWKGYGHAKNIGAGLAKHDWIFSLDADERITLSIAGALSAISLSSVRTAYSLRRMNYFGNKRIKHGSFGHDRITRLYNRLYNQWDLALVHEKLTGKNIELVILKANLVHFAARQPKHYLEKITHYAELCALRYQQEKKRFVYVKRLASPTFNFLKEYIFQAGFLDGTAGFVIARLHAIYTIKKYQRLINLLNEEKSRLSMHQLLVR